MRTQGSDKEDNLADNEHAYEQDEQLIDREMPCPVCGAPMPDLKGGKSSICPVCGFKDSCCY